jgi:hypothetical protein
MEIIEIAKLGEESANKLCFDGESVRKEFTQYGSDWANHVKGFIAGYQHLQQQIDDAKAELERVKGGYRLDIKKAFSLARVKTLGEYSYTLQEVLTSLEIEE